LSGLGELILIVSAVVLVRLPAGTIPQGTPSR
jgi:hypothetical protein